jgi:transposase
MSVYAGIDLHSNNNVLAVLDETDRVLRQRRLPNELPVILRELEPFHDELAGVVVESTYNWYWLVDGLMAHGHRVHLAHTSAVPQYAGLKHGDDESDARHLARLLRLGILPEGYIYPRAQRSVRDLLRRRFGLVRTATRLLLSVQSSWARHTGQGLSANGFRQLDGTAIEAALSDPIVRLSVLTQIKVWQSIQEQVRQMEKWVNESAECRRELIALRSIPGVGVTLSTTIALETGDVTRFADVGNYASYCRMVKSERLSNGKKKGVGNRKSGNKYLAWAYIEAATFAVRFSPEIKRWYTRKCGKCHRIVTLKAVAHKLARASFYLLRDGGRFDVHRAFR